VQVTISERATPCDHQASERNRCRSARRRERATGFEFESRYRIFVEGGIP
jgi:hypothetical protein